MADSNRKVATVNPQQVQQGTNANSGQGQPPTQAASQIGTVPSADQRRAVANYIASHVKDFIPAVIAKLPLLLETLKSVTRDAEGMEMISMEVN